jgi:hypothetical protein
MATMLLPSSPKKKFGKIKKEEKGGSLLSSLKVYHRVEAPSSLASPLS